MFGDCVGGLADVASLERFDDRHMHVQGVQSGGAKNLKLGAFGRLDHACEKDAMQS